MTRLHDDWDGFNAAEDAFRRGNPLSDWQLDLLIKHYKALNDALAIFRNPEYNLMKVDVWRRLDSLKGFKDARNQKLQG